MKLSTDLQGFIQGEWNWPISCLIDSETQERGLQGVKIQNNFKGEHFLHLQCSFRKLVSIYPTSVPGYLHSVTLQIVGLTKYNKHNLFTHQRWNNRLRRKMKGKNIQNLTKNDHSSAKSNIFIALGQETTDLIHINKKC